MVDKKRYRCEDCRLRRHAERKPASLLAKLWRWHTGWCPGWKAYQRALAVTIQKPEFRSQKSE